MDDQHDTRVQIINSFCDVPIMADTRNLDDDDVDAIADALLPLVNRLCAEAAAKALNDAAEEVRKMGPRWTLTILDDRAAALTDADGEQS